MRIARLVTMSLNLGLASTPRTGVPEAVLALQSSHSLPWTYHPLLGFVAPRSQTKTYPRPLGVALQGPSALAWVASILGA